MAILHFTWIQKKSTETRPLDKARAIKRDDTWSKPVYFFEDDGTTPRPIVGTVTGQLRLARLGPDEDEPDPVATMVIDDTDQASGIVVLSLPKAVTRDLPSAGGWYDVQLDNGTAATTILEGKWAVDDDVTRVPL